MPEPPSIDNVGQTWAEWYAGLIAARDDGKTDLIDRLERARRLIEQQYARPLDLERLAREACFSRYHFLREFRRTFGETPHRYLTLKRLERAKELLSESNLSVTYVCFEVGFQSLGSFSTLFHKAVGHPPSHHRTQVLSLSLPRPATAAVAIPVCFETMYVGARQQPAL